MTVLFHQVLLGCKVVLDIFRELTDLWHRILLGWQMVLRLEIVHELTHKETKYILPGGSVPPNRPRSLLSRARSDFLYIRLERRRFEVVRVVPWLIGNSFWTIV